MVSYLSNDKSKNFTEKLTIISDPLLSVNVDGHVDGFFAINYTNLIRKHSVFNNLLEKNTNFKRSLNVSQKIADSFSIKIYRVERSTRSRRYPVKESLIYDSQKAKRGLYLEEPM